MDGEDLADPESGEAMDSSPEGHVSGDGEGEDDDNEDDDDEDEDGGDETGGDEEDEGELEGTEAETPQQPLKKLRRGLCEETPVHGSDRELHGSSQKSLGLQIPLHVPVPPRRRHASAAVP